MFQRVLGSKHYEKTVKGSWHIEPTEKRMKGKYDCRKASRLFSVTLEGRIGTSGLKIIIIIKEVQGGLPDSASSQWNRLHIKS